MPDLFVTGVDEYSDRIFVTAGLAATMQSLGYSTGVYKPVDIGAVEKNGFIFKQGDTEGFIQYVIRMAHDENLRKQFGMSAQNKMQRFTLENALKEMASIYNRYL